MTDEELQVKLRALLGNEEPGAELGVATRPVSPDDNRMAAAMPLQEAIPAQDLATGGDVGGNMQPASAIGGEAGVEVPNQDAPGNVINPASEFAREWKNRIKIAGTRGAVA